jgi:hypothetical protein
MHKSNSEVGKSIVLSQAKVSIEEHLHASTYESKLVVELISVLCHIYVFDWIFTSFVNKLILCWRSLLIS